ncbi:MAG: hypothetical protein ACLSDI_00875 [Oscillospiraceae bacterium]
MNNSNGKTRRLAGLALFTAIVVALQLLGSFIKVGLFSVSLVLIPIVVGAAVYGVSAGAWLGFAFGVVVTIAVVTGADAGGYIMLSRAPGLDRARLPHQGHGGRLCGRSALSRHWQKHPLAGVIVAGRCRAGRQHRAVRALCCCSTAAAAGVGG